MTTIFYRGKSIEKLNHDELIDAIKCLMREKNYQIEMLEMDVRMQKLFREKRIA